LSRSLGLVEQDVAEALGGPNAAAVHADVVAAGSALTPISRIVRPLTLTRPSAISFSAARREATPA
jgi:hypothetical protein